MRIQLKIDHLPHQQLPINYPYLISSWIYHVLYSSDSAFATWLHEHGYQTKGKRYKHFCFSMLRPQRYKIHPREKVFELVEGPTELVLSFNVDKAGKDIIKGLFKDNIMQIKSGEYFKMLGMVNQVELLSPPTFSEIMQYTTQTPICVSVKEENNPYATYLEPDDERYAETFAINLVDKANAYLGDEKYHIDQVSFKLLSSKFQSKLWKIKGIKVKGYLYDFSLSAPPELQEMGFAGGFGVQNASLGMGFCEVKKKKTIRKYLS
ncbi:CRISPR-associated endoribonuclease Cas6 [Flavobacteriaceae bacterium Ap0902]|nr:CRISPR-associated endoribonuclease Cas6 [Flavobacteriaceae bacterium Ap0902]